MSGRAASAARRTRTVVAHAGLAAAAAAAIAIAQGCGGGRTSSVQATRSVPVPTPAAAGKVHCTVLARSSGDVSRLVRNAGPGTTLCLRAGITFREDVTIRRSGTRSAPIVLTSSPGPPARLLGRLVVAQSASNVIVRRLVLDGRNERGLPSPTVTGTRITFLRDDITNRRTGICMVVGSGGFGTAVDVTIRANRIHDCGQRPATNLQHGIYVASSRRLRIIGNLIYDNADRGIQLYPDAQDTLIERNVIDRNGVGVLFSGDDGVASDGNLVRHNIITNSRDRHDVEAFWPAANPIGHDNVVSGNCIGGGRLGALGVQQGFVAEDNRIGTVSYLDGTQFALEARDPCADFLPPPPVGPR
ncbi:MAG TPA: right-handed parallel beta-helix repeat-containing protein [Miltoncostaeaceae bacterium]|nr:right-handed parallel beta-helix repeat-containing protein [Miltoncostaeaceae bacterium]